MLAVPTFLIGLFGVFDPLNKKGAALGTPVASVFMAASISVGAILVAESEHLVPRAVRPVIVFVARMSVPVLLLHTLVTQLFRAHGYPATKWTVLAAYLLPLGSLR